jgi:hypothetical protein
MSDWRGPAFDPQRGVQLVDPAMVPTIRTRVDELQQDAVRLKKRGEQVRRTGERIHDRWQKLAPHYGAPEGARLLAGTERPRAKAGTAGGHLVRASDLLWHFAAELRPLVRRLEGLRQEAQALAAWAARYPTDWTWRIYPSGARVRDQPDQAPEHAALNVNRRIDEGVVDVLGRIRSLEARYARAIRDLVDTSVLPPLKTGPSHANPHERDMVAPPDWRGLRLDQKDLPWGGPRVPTDSVPARVAAGAFEGLVEMGLFSPSWSASTSSSTGTGTTATG